MPIPSPSSDMAARKTNKKSDDEGANPTVDAIKESATQIWLAGLGAFAKAQAEGEKMFDTLVRQGQRIEKKSRSATQTRITDVRDAVESTVTDVQEKATDTWDKLESVFENRVARVLGRLGVPSDDEVADLRDRVAALEKALKASSTTKTKAKRKAAKKSAAKKKAKKKVAKKKVAKKSAAKKAPRKKATKKSTKK